LLEDRVSYVVCMVMEWLLVWTGKWWDKVGEGSDRVFGTLIIPLRSKQNDNFSPASIITEHGHASIVAPSMDMTRDPSGESDSLEEARVPTPRLRTSTIDKATMLTLHNVSHPEKLKPKDRTILAAFALASGCDLFTAFAHRTLHRKFTNYSIDTYLAQRTRPSSCPNREVKVSCSYPSYCFAIPSKLQVPSDCLRSTIGRR
jgi:hypothetical protein